MLSLEEALRLLLDAVSPVPAEELALAQSAGRILAADIVAGRDQPPQPVSAMDGYAVRREDSSEAGAVLRLIGEAPAGAPFAGTVTTGTAVRIATGGVVPEGADRVVMQEIVERDGDTIRLREAPGEAHFVRAAGSDFRAGVVVAEKGEQLTPARLGLAAAANHGFLQVHRRPRVAILASGDELREPGSRLGSGEIVNSAAYAVAALAERWGADSVRHPILPDDRDACRNRLDCADLNVDLIVPLGGASVGDRDWLRPLFEESGARIAFDKVAVQPGKPTWHARFADGRLVLGLPGNPASAFVCAHLFLNPLLHRLTGCRGDPARLVPARLTHPLGRGGARELYLRARAEIDGEGVLRVAADPRQDSSLQTPLAAANALLRRPIGAPAAAPGDLVEILPIADLL